MIHPSHKMRVDPTFRPFIDLMEAQYLTTNELAERWRYSAQGVHNMRRNGTGAAYVKLPGGAIRYRASEIIACELYGHGGGLTMDRVAFALACCPGLKLDAREKIEAHLRGVLCAKTEG